MVIPSSSQMIRPSSQRGARGHHPSPPRGRFGGMSTTGLERSDPNLSHHPEGHIPWSTGARTRRAQLVPDDTYGIRNTSRSAFLRASNGPCRTRTYDHGIKSPFRSRPILAPTCPLTALLQGLLVIRRLKNRLGPFASRSHSVPTHRRPGG